MMSDYELLTAVNQGEAQDWEFKSAKGGVPGSMWETYSAMANTQGGVIALGVEERDDTCIISGVDNPERKLKNIWDELNNKHHVSLNLLTASHLYAKEIEGKTIIVMQVPRASRYERPVFIGLNPMAGTYRRDRTGDYKCSPEAVRRMLADQLESPPDSQILPFLTREHLDPASVQQYRNRFASRDPDHAWLALSLDEFLERLGAWRRDLRTGEEGITVAGILMFGKHEYIARPEVLPNYHVDYREPPDKPSTERWADRLWPNGKWVANLFQFFYETLPRLYRGLKVPFQLRDATRIDETPAHVAIREALVNSLIHADHSGVGGVVIMKTRERITLENPGTLLVSYEQLQRGGYSECRNKSLQVMFSMLGLSEKAGSGMDKIREGSRYLHSLPFAVSELTDSSRVNVQFPYASMLPEGSVAHLEALYNEGLDTLDPDERLALVIAEDEREVSNLRLQLASDKHPADLMKLLRGLVQKGFLTADKNTRPRIYHLSRLSPGTQSAQLDLMTSEGGGESHSPEETLLPVGTGTLPHNEQSLPQNAPASPHNEQSPPHKAQDTANEGESPSLTGGLLTAAERERALSLGLSVTEVEALREQAYASWLPRRATRDTLHTAILRVCESRFFTSTQIAFILRRDRDTLRDRYLSPMVEEGLLVLLYPKHRSHMRQAYKTALLDTTSA